MTQYTPALDTFDAGSPAYNTRVLGWLICMLNTTDYRRGLLNNYYADNVKAGHKAANAAATDEVAAEDEFPKGWVRRETFQADVSVRASFYVAQQASGREEPWDPSKLEEFGLLARVQGGSVTGTGTNTVRIITASGYVFRCQGQGDQSMKFELVRYDTGVATVLATTTSTVAWSQAIDWEDNFELMLVVEDATLGVSLKGYLVDAVRNGLPGYGPVLMLEYVDEFVRNFGGRTEDLSNGYWTTAGTGTTTVNTTVAPDGTTTADTIDSTSASDRYTKSRTFTGLTNGQLYTVSWYIKQGTAARSSIVVTHGSGLKTSRLRIEWATETVVVEDFNGATGVGYVVRTVQGYYRFILTLAYDSGEGTDFIARVEAADGQTAATGTSIVWGFQIEEGAVATEYQPVIGADTLAPPLTGAGRCGFTMSSARQYNSPEIYVADICDWWQVAKASDVDAVLYREEWVRHLARFAEKNGADDLGNQGYIVQGDYTLDEFGAIAGFATTELDRSGDRAQYVPPGSGGQHIFIASKPAADQYTQRRRITINFGSGTTASYLAGICLRANWDPDTVLSMPAAPAYGGFGSMDGYVAFAWSSAGTKMVSIYRAGTGRAERIADVAGTWPIGSDFTLDFECRPVGDLAPHGDVETAYVEMRVWIDGTLAVLANPGGVSDVTWVGGVVTDQAATRVQSGLGEGFTAGEQGTPGDRTIQFDSWERRPLGPRVDQQNIVVANEGTPTLIVNNVLDPQYSVSVSDEYSTLTYPFESGHRGSASEYGDASGAISRRTFTFRAPVTTPEEHQRIESFFDETKGVEDALVYRDENGANIDVQFLAHTLNRYQSAPGVFGTEFQLRELLNTT